MKQLINILIFILFFSFLCSNILNAQVKTKLEIFSSIMNDTSEMKILPCFPGTCLKLSGNDLGCIYGGGWNSGVQCNPNYPQSVVHMNNGTGWICTNNAELITNLTSLNVANLCNYKMGCSNDPIPANFGPIGCNNSPTGMVAWFPFDEYKNECEISREIVNLDSYGLLDWHNVTPACGYVYYAIKFNGNNSYLEASNVTGIEFGPYQNFSIAVWVNFSAFNVGINTLLDKRITLSNNKIKGYHLAYEKISRRFVLQLGTGDGSNYGYSNCYSNNIQNGIPLNTWHHLVVTVRRGGPLLGRKVKFYLDGESIGEAWNIKTGDLANGVNLLVGKRFDNAAYFRGMLDELQFFNTQLTPADIHKIYDAKIFGLCKNSNYIPCQ